MQKCRDVWTHGIYRLGYLGCKLILALGDVWDIDPEDTVIGATALEIYIGWPKNASADYKLYN